MTTAYRYAKWYVNHCGFSVTPLHPRSKARLFRGNDFQHRPPSDGLLRKHFDIAQPYGIAIVPGEISDNLVVIDFDELAVYRTWIALVPEAATLPLVRSARGVHVYVRLNTLPIAGSYCNGQFEGVPFGQIICRGAITAPPSVHPSGHVYRWQGNPATLPLFSCLADLGLEKHSADAPVSAMHIEQSAPRPMSGIRNPVAYAQAGFAAEIQRLAATTENRNYALFRAAWKLAKYLQLMGETAIVSALEATAIQIGLERREIASTIRSGLRRGAAQGVLSM